MQEDILGYIPFEYHSGEYFALRVRGDSMIGAGILDGDDVIVRPPGHRRSKGHRGGHAGG